MSSSELISPASAAVSSISSAEPAATVASPVFELFAREVVVEVYLLERDLLYELVAAEAPEVQAHGSTEQVDVGVLDVENLLLKDFVDGVIPQR